MKILDGRELASYIKSRQQKEVSTLRINYKKVPKLAIVQLKDDPVIDIYVGLKKKYGDDIGVAVESSSPCPNGGYRVMKKLNNDKSVDGIIVQLPIENPSQTDEILNQYL